MLSQACFPCCPAAHIMKMKLDFRPSAGPCGNPSLSPVFCASLAQTSGDM
ncbi:hypothetical protein LEMLEM_LOCUS13441 [Lemmus lemmus]